MLAGLERGDALGVVADDDSAVADGLHDPLPLEVPAVVDVEVEQHAGAAQQIPLAVAEDVVGRGLGVGVVGVREHDVRPVGGEHGGAAGEQLGAAPAPDAEVHDVDVALGVELLRRARPRPRPPERRVLGPDPLLAEGGDAARADVEHRRAVEVRQARVLVEEPRARLLGAQEDRPLELGRRRMAVLRRQREPLVRRDEHDDAVGVRGGHAVVADRGRDPEVAELEAQRVDELDEEAVLALGEAEDDLWHALSAAGAPRERVPWRPGPMGETVVPERFVPAAMRGQLVEAEHLVRYWWAARFAPGKRVLDAGCGMAYGTAMLAGAGAEQVTGIDRATAVLDAARPAAPENVELVAGDLRSLPFADRSFDLVVCFEVIEHLDEPDAALRELERVLRRDGILLISSPNRDVYEPGNPHHLHEYTPPELRVALERYFTHVELRRQANLIASAVMPDDIAVREALEGVQDVQLAKCVPVVPGRETYTLALASHSALPPDRTTTAVATGLTEIRKWLELYDEQHAAVLDRDERIRRLDADALEVRRARARLVEGEQDHARLIQLREELAAARAENERLRDELDRAATTMAGMRRSPSWRLTAPLRGAKRFFRRP